MANSVAFSPDGSVTPVVIAAPDYLSVLITDLREDSYCQIVALIYPDLDEVDYTEVVVAALAPGGGSYTSDGSNGFIAFVDVNQPGVTEFLVGRVAGWYDNVILYVRIIEADVGNPNPYAVLDVITTPQSSTYIAPASGGGSYVAPTVVQVSPTLGDPIARFDEVVIDVTGGSMTVPGNPIGAFYARGTYDVIFDGTAFTLNYAICRREVIGGGHRYFLRRVGGWREAPSFEVLPV